MSCKDTIHLLCWYLEGKLSSAVESEVEQHVRHCANCHLVLDAAVNTLDEFLEGQRSPQALAIPKVA